MITKADAARILLSLRTTTTTAPATTTTTAPPRAGSTRATALAAGTQFVLGSFYVIVDGSPDTAPELSSGTPTGFTFVGVNATLICGSGSETPCNNGLAQRSEISFALTDSAGTEYARISPQFTPDLQDSPSISVSSLSGTTSFKVPTTALGDLVIKATTSTSSTRNPTHVRVTP